MQSCNRVSTPNREEARNKSQANEDDRGNVGARRKVSFVITANVEFPAVVDAENRPLFGKCFGNKSDRHFAISPRAGALEMLGVFDGRDCFFANG